MNFTDPMGLDGVSPDDADYCDQDPSQWWDEDHACVNGRLINTDYLDIDVGNGGITIGSGGGAQQQPDPCNPQPRQIFRDARQAAEAGARYVYNHWRDANRLDPGDVRERGVRVGQLGGGYSFDGLVYGPEGGGPV